MTELPAHSSKGPATSAAQCVYDHMLAELESDPNLSDLRAELPDLSQALWDWSQLGDPDERRFRIREAMGGHILEVTGPDCAFLVDSLLGACSALGVQADALFHPIVERMDGAFQSLIQIHLPHLTEPETQMLCDEVVLTLRDVRLATDDFEALRNKMAEGIERLTGSVTVPSEYQEEAIAFLNWLTDDHFVFLGAREYRFKTDETGQVLPMEPDFVEGSNLGLLRDLDLNVLRPGSEPLFLTKEIGAFLAEPEPLILAKATLVSRVHRRVPADYVGIKHFDSEGRVTGETRFLGLYTSEAYHASICTIPLLRQRRAKVLEITHSVSGSHNEKAITSILESWPRDELFQTNADILAPIIRGAANLIGRPRVRMFVRPDRFARFVSVIVFVPREAYDTALRQRLSTELEGAYRGHLAAFEPEFVGVDLVRILFEVTLRPDSPQPDLQLLEARLAELSRTWQTRFRSAMTAMKPDGRAPSHAAFFVTGFNAAYREAFEPQTAVDDIDILMDLGAACPIAVRAFRDPQDPDRFIRAKIYSRSGSIALSECVPVFERMGLFVAFEAGYPITPARKPYPDSPDTFWVHALYLRRSDNADIDLDEVRSGFEDAFVAIWRGDAENDGFNGLIFNAGLSWREAALLRALCAYRHQTGMDPGRMTQIEALNRHAPLTKMLTTLFETRFDPDRGLSLNERRRALKKIWRQIDQALAKVESLNHDRVLRRLAHLIMAIQRTNFYQRDIEGHPLGHISIKIASGEIDDLPKPKPHREIFVASPVVEGVHCRFGPVARGGLRWSDRRDDFRTEVLGLVKAQQVKNSVIVPVGAKGGFFAKLLPDKGHADDRQAAGIGAYQIFVQALLGLTDNLQDGDIVHPSRTVIWDQPDPYLVVAADKGTATFSDIANGISTELGFWLGDAFASGGSAGYDHKAMGITARGGWEAVKRHFRELGTDIQTEPFSVIGIGDMSGDVFGNGMLLSRQTRLLGAFNHRHIFIDPDPQDREASWRERERLFNLKGSGWDDYDQTLLSSGGRIFDRNAKEVVLTPEIQNLTGLQTDRLTPDELVHALLKTPCDLLWFGGIGTYIKASSERHADADDRSNDHIRINAEDVGARIIGEGANLGMTQAARVAFALRGGRVNTDAIDNSAGVDSSDQEVNIKILCLEAIRQGTLVASDRDDLLASMTDEVAAHVLKHNYDQTHALSLAETQAPMDHDAYERLMCLLESRDRLDRDVEGLPGTAQMQERQDNGQFLTRPEIAVLMAWSKITLFDDLIASSVPDDPFFADALMAYFPAPICHQSEALTTHPLKREIIATILSNKSIDLGGPVLVMRLTEECNASPGQVVKALETAGALIGREQLEDAINHLDNHIATEVQLHLKQTLASGTAALAATLLNGPEMDPVGDVILKYEAGFRRLRSRLPDCLTPQHLEDLEKAKQLHAAQGVPSSLSVDLADLTVYANLPALAEIATKAQATLEDVFGAFETIGAALGTEDLSRIATAVLPGMGTWDRRATRRLIRELDDLQLRATRHALQAGGAQMWLTKMDPVLRSIRTEIETYTTRQPGFSQLALAADTIRAAMNSER